MRAGVEALSLFGFILLACLPLQAQSAKERGQQLFQTKGCTQCHSIGNVGGSKGPSLDAVGKRLKKQQIERQIEQGSLAMPSFAEALSKEELHTLIEYLHSCKHDLPSQKTGK